MLKLPPFDKIGVTPTPDFVNASPEAGIPGSIVNGLIFNALQDELQDAISGAGLTPTDSDYTQILQSLSFGGIFIGTFGDSTDAYSSTIPGSVIIPALKSGMRVIGYVAAANTTTTPTLAIAGFTTGSAPAPIRRRDGTAVSIGDIAATLMAFRFDGTYWRVDGLVASDILAIVGGSGGGGSGGGGTSSSSVYALSGFSANSTGSAPGGTKTASFNIKQIIAAGGSGSTYRGSALTLNFNGAGTGAGGMDTGSTPTSADLHIFAIYNPTTTTWNTLGYAGALSSDAYPGSNMPSGYTTSQLIFSGKTDSSGNIKQFDQLGREVWTAENVLVFGATQTSVTALSIASCVPANASSCRGYTNIGSQDSDANQGLLLTDSTGNLVFFRSDQSAGQQGTCTWYAGYPLFTAVTLYYLNLSANETHATIAVSGYRF